MGGGGGSVGGPTEIPSPSSSLHPLPQHHAGKVCVWEGGWGVSGGEGWCVCEGEDGVCVGGGGWCVWGGWGDGVCGG